MAKRIKRCVNTRTMKPRRRDRKWSGFPNPWTCDGVLQACNGFGQVWKSGPWRVLLTVESQTEDGEIVADPYVRGPSYPIMGQLQDIPCVVHLSLSHANVQIWPTWQQLVELRNEFFGPETDAIQTIPPQKEWMSVRNNCFHIFARQDRGRIMCWHPSKSL